MSTKQNDNYLEDMQEEYAYTTPERKEKIIEELKNEGYVDEANTLMFEDAERQFLGGDISKEEFESIKSNLNFE